MLKNRVLTLSLHLLHISLCKPEFIKKSFKNYLGHDNSRRSELLAPQDRCPQYDRGRLWSGSTRIRAVLHTTMINQKQLSGGDSRCPL